MAAKKKAAKAAPKPARSAHTAHLKRAGRDWAVPFLAALARSPNVSAAAEAAQVGRRTAYERKAADPGFAAAWADALEQATDHLVGEAYRRAREGTDKPVFYKGEQCGSVREYSDTLAVFLLKSHRPGVYGDRSRLEVSGPDGGAIPIALAELPDDDLALLESIAERVAVPRPDGRVAGDPG